MTIKDLIEKLKTFPQDLDVATEWDESWSEMHNEDITLQKDKNDKPVVIIAVSEWGSF